MYTVATLWEMKQTSHHIERCVQPRPEERQLTLVTPPDLDQGGVIDRSAGDRVQFGSRLVLKFDLVRPSRPSWSVDDVQARIATSSFRW